MAQHRVASLIQQTASLLCQTSTQTHGFLYYKTCSFGLRTERLRDLKCVFDTLCHAESLHCDSSVFHHFLAVKLVKIQPSHLRNNARTCDTQLHTTQTHLICMTCYTPLHHHYWQLVPVLLPLTFSNSVCSQHHIPCTVMLITNLRALLKERETDRKIHRGVQKKSYSPSTMNNQCHISRNDHGKACLLMVQQKPSP